MKLISYFSAISYRRLPAAAAVVLALAAAAPARADLLFDNFTGATISLTTSMPRTYMGGMFDLSLPPSSTGALITGGTFYIATNVTASYTNIQLNLQFWDTVLATSGSGPAFGTAVGSVQSFDGGPLTNTGTQYYSMPVTFSTPFFLSANTTHGVAVNWKGDTGSGLQDTNNLTSLLRYTAPYAVGSSSINGYFRNASGLTTMNFLGSDLRTLGAPNNLFNSIAFKLEGTPVVPEPSTWALLAGLGALAAAVAWRRRTRA